MLWVIELDKDLNPAAFYLLTSVSSYLLKAYLKLVDIPQFSRFSDSVNACRG
jgi:hypothetical protein